MVRVYFSSFPQLELPHSFVSKMGIIHISQGGLENQGADVGWYAEERTGQCRDPSMTLAKWEKLPGEGSRQHTVGVEGRALICSAFGKLNSNLLAHKSLSISRRMQTFPSRGIKVSPFSLGYLRSIRSNRHPEGNIH